MVVVATSDEPALLRVQAAQTATAIAEYFRDTGRDVLLLMDSLTRFAMAQREIGLAAGEPPTTRGYPPSVFGLLPKLVERAGRAARGSITGFYSVLVEGDDPQEPIADAVRGLLDGHIWLSRKMAGRGHYPAIDILGSLSRLMSDITPRAQQDAALAVRELLGAYRDHEDLISIGAYRRGQQSKRGSGDRLARRNESVLAATRGRTGEAGRRRCRFDSIAQPHDASTECNRRQRGNSRQRLRRPRRRPLRRSPEASHYEFDPQWNKENFIV